MQVQTKEHRADFLINAMSSGLSAMEAILKMKKEADYNPRHRDAQGRPLTFEAAVSDYIHKHGMQPQQAVRAATASHSHLQGNYYSRLQIDTILNLQHIIKSGI